MDVPEVGVSRRVIFYNGRVVAVVDDPWAGIVGELVMMIVLVRGCFLSGCHISFCVWAVALHMLVYDWRGSLRSVAAPDGRIGVVLDKGMCVVRTNCVLLLCARDDMAVTLLMRVLRGFSSKSCVDLIANPFTHPLSDRRR